MVRDTADDDEWLEALRSGDDSKHPDAARLKRALEQRAHRLSAEVPVADQRMYSELRFRLRREKLLKEGQVGYRLVAVAASVLAVTAITFALLPDQQALPDYSSVRSAGDGPGVFVVDPELEAQALVVRLRATGIDAQLQRVEDKVIVSVPASLDAIDALEQMKITSTKAGDRLEVIYRRSR